jgi:2-polyprenyl-6-methoxyphenol hydroxylase-like FAD-dependent oxidoreductase
MFLAGELRVGGANPLLVEATQGARSKSGSWGERGISGRSAQILTLRGLAPALADAAMTWSETVAAAWAEKSIDRLPPGADQILNFIQLMREGKTGGHFGMFPLKADGENSDRCYSMKQHMLEQVLADWIGGLGVPLETSVHVIGVRDEGSHAVADLADGRSISARYIVGCDGGRSTVRKSAGFDFIGTPATYTGRVASVEFADSSSFTAVGRGPNGLMNSLMVPGEVTIVEFDGTGPVDRNAPVTIEELEGSMLRAAGVKATINTMDGGTRFSDNTRQVDNYRRGRIMVAGDAAHVHSPIGGQGVNMGLQDASNLGWKLASVVTGRAPESLLDTYNAERHPIVAKVLRSTRAQVALMRPGPQVEALREIMGDVMAIPEAHDYFSALVSNVNIDYAPDAAQPQVGRFIPSELRSVVSEHMPDGRFLLLDLANSYAIRDVVAGNHRVRYLPRQMPGASVGALLIRPDGYVAWVSSVGSAAGLAEALEQWGTAPHDDGAASGRGGQV